MPHIQKLLDAIQAFTIATQRAGYNKQKWAKARFDLRKALEELNIADKFDWSEE